MNIHLLGLLAILFSLIFSGCSKDEDEGGSSTFKINGTPSYASTLGDFLNGEFLGANFSDKSKLDGCLYAYGCYYDKDVSDTFTEISLYFSPTEFSETKIGEELKISKDKTHQSQCWIAKIKGGSRKNLYDNFKEGNITFESYNTDSKLLKLHFSNVVFADNSDSEINLDGVAIFVFKDR